MNLKRKTEKGFAAYLSKLAQGTPPLSRYGIYEGSEADDRALPSIMVICEADSEAFPQGPKTQTLEILIATQIDDNDSGNLPSTRQRRAVRAKHDTALEQLNEALDGTTARQDIYNFLNEGSADTSRPVADYYFYDITKTDEKHTFEGRCFVDSITFSVICEATDSTGTPAPRFDSTRYTFDMD